MSLTSNPVIFSGAWGILKLLGLSITTEFSLQSEAVIAKKRPEWVKKADGVIRSSCWRRNRLSWRKEEPRSDLWGSCKSWALSNLWVALETSLPSSEPGHPCYLLQQEDRNKPCWRLLLPSGFWGSEGPLLWEEWLPSSLWGWLMKSVLQPSLCPVLPPYPPFPRHKFPQTFSG